MSVRVCGVGGLWCLLGEGAGGGSLCVVCLGGCLFLGCGRLL